MMKPNLPENRINDLRRLIEKYSYQYHVLDDSSVDDETYDSLFNELKRLELENPDLITPDSPTQRVGNKILDGFEKAQHKFRMLSLNDVFNFDDVVDWVKRIEKMLIGLDHEYFVDIKMDGLACSLIYEDGVFVQAITRGDGFVGEDVTENVRTIRNVPLRLLNVDGYENLLVGRTEIRGEIVILKDDFEKLNAQRRERGEPEFANPRNLAAGTIRQLDTSVVASRPLSFRSYDLIRNDESDIPTWGYAYEAARSIGLSNNTQASVFNNLQGVMDYINEWDQKRNDLPFNTDGLVVKVNNRVQYNQLGIVGKQPRAAVAYKYAAEKKLTIVKDIVISLGRTGAATPVAVLEPVVVAGSLVSHASLHNADEVERKDVRIGDTVIVYKAGDIIPQIDSVVLDLRPEKSKKYDFKTELIRQFPDLEFERPEGEVVYRAKGLNGVIILKRAVQHFASKGALNIDTLGEKNVEALVDNDLINDLADIFKLTEDQVVKLDRFAEVSAKKLVNAISNAKKPSLPRFLFGLGIRHVGVQTAIDLANNFKSIDKLSEATIDQLRDIEGIGEVVAESLVAWFSDEDNIALLAKFSSLGVEPYFEKLTGKLSGMNFVVTGTLETMSRDEAAGKIRGQGGTFQTAIARDTTYLVAGKKVGASKLKKATEYGVEIIDEDKLISLLAN